MIKIRNNTGLQLIFDNDLVITLDIKKNSKEIKLCPIFDIMAVTTTCENCAISIYDKKQDKIITSQFCDNDSILADELPEILYNIKNFRRG